MNLKILSSLAFAASVAGIAGLAFRHSLFSSSPVVVVIQAMAFLFMVWARVTFGSRSFHLAANPTAGKLVTTGPYRFVRHPIYSSILAFSMAGIAANLSVESVVLGLVILLGTCTRVILEERMLHATYPEYAGYAEKTRRLIPFVY